MSTSKPHFATGTTTSTGSAGAPGASPGHVARASAVPAIFNAPLDAWGFGPDHPMSVKQSEVDLIVLHVFLSSTSESSNPHVVEVSIRSLYVPGLTWATAPFSVIEVGYGVKCLVVQAKIRVAGPSSFLSNDDSESLDVDTVEELIATVPGVRSVAFVAFTKV